MTDIPWPLIAAKDTLLTRTATGAWRRRVVTTVSPSEDAHQFKISATNPDDTTGNMHHALTTAVARVIAHRAEVCENFSAVSCRHVFLLRVHDRLPFPQSPETGENTNAMAVLTVSTAVVENGDAKERKTGEKERRHNVTDPAKPAKRKPERTTPRNKE